MATTTLLTFNDLIKIEPRLGNLYWNAKHYRVRPGYCPLNTWYRTFKPELIKLVGFGAESENPVLHTTEVYELVYDKIYESLSPCPRYCRGCGK